MHGKGQLIENGKTLTLLYPQSVSNSAKESLWVSMRHWKKLQISIHVGANAGTSTNHIAVTLTQATTSGGTDKALAFDRHYTQPITQLVDAATAVDTASNTFNIVAGTANTEYIIEINDTQLDLANDYQWVHVELAASGEAAAILLCVVGVLYDADYAGKPATLPSAVAPSPV